MSGKDWSPCRERGIKSVAVTAGYMCDAPRREFYQHIDAANVDLKAFTEAFYFKTCSGHPQPVLDTPVYRKHETAVGHSQGAMMTIQVQCYAGYRGEQEPRAFVLGEQRLDVVAIADRWLAPDHRYFKVAAGDGNTYVLRHDERSGEWTLGAYHKGQE